MTTSRLIGLCMGLGAAVALADPVPVATLDETDMFPFVPMTEIGRASCRERV